MVEKDGSPKNLLIGVPLAMVTNEQKALKNELRGIQKFVPY